jgi:hypothetical protein
MNSFLERNREKSPKKHVKRQFSVVAHFSISTKVRKFIILNIKDEANT